MVFNLKVAKLAEKDTSTLSSREELGHANDHALVSDPKSDLNDPLNWSNFKRCGMFSIMCFATFTGIATTTAPLLALVVQAKTFHTSTIVLSYSVSATLAGLTIGPALLVPLAKVFGISSCTFWSLLAIVATSIWGAKASGPDDYVSYAVSRGFFGLFAAIPQILTGGFIVNVFHLHEQGKAFAVNTIGYTGGTIVGATFCGFIIEYTTWPVALWWTVGSNGLAAILVLLFVEDTTFDRVGGQNPKTADSWIGNRFETFFPGTKVVHRTTVRQVLKNMIAPFRVSVSPIILLAGLFSLAYYGFFVLVFIQLVQYLQEPYAPAKHMFGYGFSAQNTAIFFFASWIGAILAILYGIAFNDRIPLAVSRRRGDKWRPEYRLHAIWFPALVMPIGLGLFGACLEYHLHFIVLAAALFLIAFSTLASMPIAVNYGIEAFGQYPQEVGAALNAYRQVLAVSVSFFFAAWEKKVGIGWVFGMAAFFCFATFLGMVLLAFAGEKIRKVTIGKSAYQEEDEADGQ